MALYPLSGLCRGRGHEMARPRRYEKHKPSKHRLDRVLVVCEGKKTEPQYFQDFREQYQLRTLTVEGVGGDPLAVVKNAISLYAQEKNLGEQYDAVWCVFDRDCHPHFERASEMAKAKGFMLARSWPCFEYWLLLHFVYSRKPYAERSDRSPCAACIEDLHKHLEYEKSGKGVFDRTHDRLCVARQRAKQALEDALTDNESNPSTEVHQLVNGLLALAGKSRYGVAATSTTAPADPSRGLR